MAKISEFLVESKKELKKVQWPQKPTVMQTSAIVVVCALIFSVYLWLIDLGLGQIFSLLFYR